MFTFLSRLFKKLKNWLFCKRYTSPELVVAALEAGDIVIRKNTKCLADLFITGEYDYVTFKEKKMNIEEANKIIEEFMGGEKSSYSCNSYVATLDDGTRTFIHQLPSNSLDTLVPVLEELNTRVGYQVINNITNIIARDLTDGEFKTQEAAAIATAKAIKELK